MLLVPHRGMAQAPPVSPAQLTVARITSEEFDGESSATHHWLEDGSAYLALEASEDGKRPEIVRHDPASGRREVLVSTTELTSSGAREPLHPADFAISKDSRKLLLFTNTRKVWRMNTRGDYWLFDRETRTLRKLGGKAPEASLMFATFDPAGQKVAYVRDNNLYVEEAATGQITALTTDRSPTLVNGTFDWVYEEELFLRNGYRWSPDGKSIAYWQLDSTGVPEYPILNTAAGLYPRVVPVRYPRTGQKNSSVRVGVVPVGGGATRWIAVPGDPRDNYIVRMSWVPDSHELLIQHLNRRQNVLEVLRADSRDGSVRSVLTDRDDAWVDVADDLHFFDHGQAFTWTADREGWRRLETVRTRENRALRLMTGDMDVIRVVAVDEKHKHAYYMASPANPTQSYLYRVPLDGSGQARRVTPLDQPGTHHYGFAPGCAWAFHTFSSFGRPPVTELVSMPDHRVVRTLVGNAKLRGKLDALVGDRGEFFRVEIPGGAALDGWCIKPPGFDPTRKYPLLVHVYGEPASQNVVDEWGGDTYLWHRMLAQKGYIVLSVDNRGTPAPRGREWRKCVYRQVGILAPREQAQALERCSIAGPFWIAGGWPSGAGAVAVP